MSGSADRAPETAPGPGIWGAKTALFQRIALSGFLSGLADMVANEMLP